MTTVATITQRHVPARRFEVAQVICPEQVLVQLLRIASVFATLALVIAIYVLVIRPWQSRWGTTPAELVREMPGDHLVRSPSFSATRAITIDARPEQIWPWLIQMGCGRAGFYGYDWLDNGFYASADSIVPALQNLEVGDEVPTHPWAFREAYSIDFNRSMVLRHVDRPCPASRTWALYPLDRHKTRLVTRVRRQYHWTSPVIILELAAEARDLAAVRRSMRGFKQRVEGGTPRRPVSLLFDGALWFLALVAFVAAALLLVVRADRIDRWMVMAFTLFTLFYVLFATPLLWTNSLLVLAAVAGLVWVRRKPAPERERPRKTKPF